MASAQEFEKVLDKSDKRLASFTHDRTLLERLQHFLHANNSAAPLIILLLSLLAFGIIIDAIPIGMGWRSNLKFFNGFTLTLIVQQVAITGILGAAQTIVILTAGIDLSVGAIMVLCSVVMGQFFFRYGIPVPLAILSGLGCGALCGYINGLLVARMKLPPFIVTLGTWQVYSAVRYIYSKNETIRGQDVEQFAPLLQFFGIQFKIGSAVITLGVIFMVLLAVFLWYVLFYTAWGRRLYAVGDDPDAAELSGVQVNRMLIAAYTISGLICAVAGWVLIGRIGSVSPTAGENANVEAITAVVIGGISLFGGRGSILGMIFGGLTVGVYSLGLRLIGADPQYTYLFIGVLIIAAVAIDQWIRKVSA
jgi:fructose transport system permease protein